MLNDLLIEAVQPLILQLTVDLSECLESSWAVALSTFGPNLLPFHTFGRHPDLNRCVEYTETAAAEQRLKPERADTRELSSSEPWMPRVISLLGAGGDVFGVVVFGPKTSGAEYTAKDRDLIDRTIAHLSFLVTEERMAPRISQQLARLQRSKVEMETARQVQNRCFPNSLPPVKGLDYYGECQPVGEVGGDFFDFVAVDDSSLLISIGDVSGKGVPAAIIMAGVQASIRLMGLNMGVHNTGRISDLVRDLNQMVWQMSPESFYATMFYARVDGARRELHYVNAGHDAAILVRKNARRPVKLKSTGTVLGLSRRTGYEQRSIRLEPGDVLVAVTDGITEAETSDGRFLNEELITETVREHPGGSSSDLAAHIIQGVDSFTRGAAPADDRTVIVVRFLEQPVSGTIGNHAFAHAVPVHAATA